MADEILYLRREDVAAAGVPYLAMIDEVERGFLDWVEGRAVGHPKVVSLTPHGSFFYSLNAWSERLGIHLSHNSMGVQAELAPAGEHHLNGLAIVSELRTAKPIAVVDTFWLSTWIPAAASGVFARALARPDSRSVGMIATGAQARVHLPALKAVLPHLDRVVAYNRGRRGAEVFAAEARAQGWQVEIADHPREAAEADVVVSAIPVSKDSKPLADPAWVKPGAFVSAVDLGRAWHPGLERFERVLTDDRAQAEHEIAIGRFKLKGPFEADLKDIASGKVAPRRDAAERVVACHSGHAIGVMALAALALKHARASGVGTKLAPNWR